MYVRLNFSKPNAFYAFIYFKYFSYKIEMPKENKLSRKNITFRITEYLQLHFSLAYNIGKNSNYSIETQE